jgi:threonine synthase
VARFVAATNANDVVPEYLLSGTYRPWPSLRTISNAMDVGDPSNLERILHLYGGDLDRLRSDLVASSHDDDATRAGMREVFERTGTILDPHTAVGYLGLSGFLERRDEPWDAVLLATAHPAKFGDVVGDAIGVEPELPERLAACLRRKRRVTRIDPTLDQLTEVLTEG